MKSIRTVFKSGYGPSSSHTVGPTIASKVIDRKYVDYDFIEVTLFGSLALTAKGHGTDKAIEAIIPNAKIILDKTKRIDELPHPNTMIFKTYKDGKLLGEDTVLSIGGGDIKVNNEIWNPGEVYSEKNFSEIIEECEKRNITLPEFIYEKEEDDFKDELRLKWSMMKDCINRGLNTTGVLPGDLGIERKAKFLYEMKVEDEGETQKEDRLISSYAFAAAEENAAGHMVVIAPTCGSCGVLSAVLYFMEHDRKYTEDEIIDGLAVAGLVGNIIRTNASVSGAECGCQAEIGSACSMTAAALAQLNHLNLKQIEYAAEVAMEHHLGLTCDPVHGYVQMPCIERNAIAAMRAVNSVNISKFLYLNRKISFDAVVETMYKTGCDLSEKYRETSSGGLASMFEKINK